MPTFCVVHPPEDREHGDEREQSNEPLLLHSFGGSTGGGVCFTRTRVESSGLALALPSLGFTRTSALISRVRPPSADSICSLNLSLLRNRRSSLRTTRLAS